jgi:hypothetical protein
MSQPSETGSMTVFFVVRFLLTFALGEGVGNAAPKFIAFETLEEVLIPKVACTSLSE